MNKNEMTQKNEQDNIVYQETEDSIIQTRTRLHTIYSQNS